MAEASKRKMFVPLECNPDVFNALALNWGIQGVEFHDVYSLDPDMLAFIPRPVLAVLMVFPVSDAYESYRHSQDASAVDYKQSGEPDEKALWYKQTIGNACGTMAFLHAIANAVPDAQIDEPGKQILADTRPLTAEERTNYLETSKLFEQLHASVAPQGDTAAPAAEDPVEFHYVALTTAKNTGEVVELDGRRKGPIVRGPKVDDLLGPETVKIIQEFMDREQNGAFSIIAMTAA